MKKRSDGRYQLSVMIGYNENGKPRRKLVYGRTQKEVKEKANELRMQHNMGLIIDDDMTVGAWADTWIKTYKNGVGYNTKRIYQGILDVYVTPRIGHLKLKDVKTAHLQKIVNDNSNKKRTTELFKLTVSQMLGQAVTNDLLIKNPALGISLPTMIAETRKRALTESETERIKSLEMDEKTRCFIFILLYTGMRRGEALALTKADIDIESKEIIVNKTLIFKKNRSEVKLAPKTKAGTRIIPLLTPLHNILLDYIKTVETEYLFTTRDDKTMTITGYRRMWERFERVMYPDIKKLTIQKNEIESKEKAGEIKSDIAKDELTAISDKIDAIKKDMITAHIFRHNFATIIYNAGVDVKTAQNILGHSSINVTMDIYTHLNNKNKEQAANKLNEYLV